MSLLFPELEGGQAAGTEPLALPAPETPAAVADARETVLVGGPWSAAKFSQLLGLPGPFTAEGGCRVGAARAFSDGRIELDLTGGGIPARTLWFRPKAGAGTPDAEAGFEIGTQGEADHDGLRMILGQAGHRLRHLDLRQLRKVLLVDPAKRLEFSAPAGPPQGGAERHPGPDEGKDPKDMLKSLVQVYGSSESWYNFFADKEQQRNFCFNFAGSVLRIGHEDLECHYATPPVGDGSVSFFNYPRVHERHNPAEQDPGKASERPAENTAGPELLSDLQDLDIIKGGAKKLDRLLDGIAERENKPDMVIVRATCVPIVIGDDMEGSVERFKGKSDVPIVFLDNIANQFATPFRETFAKLRDDPGFQNPEKRPGSVNLVGFPRVAEMAPLLSFLEDELGIAINCRVVPEVDLKAMKRFKAADLSVMFDTELYARTYQDVFEGIDLRSIRPPAPYGVAGTRRWLGEIAAAVGRESGFEAAWDGRYSRVAERWESLKREAGGYRLGYVVDGERIRMLTDPRKATGIPMVAMLKEMGFAVDFLVFVGDKPRPEAHKALESASERHRVTTFRTPAELESLLKASDAQAFYSEVFFDRRLTRCGKSQFSVQMFQMGLEGAVATLDRLLSVCRMPFYRKYGTFLGQAFPA